MSANKSWLCGFWVAGLLSACSIHGVEDVGEVCFRATESDAPVEVFTIGNGAPSGQCVENVEHFCEATADGNVITVRSETTWQKKLGRCVTNAIALAPTPVFCDETPPLPPGTYTVVHGADVRQIELPLDSCPVDEIDNP